MEVKKFYRTQREVASIINEIIDEYWLNNLTDEELEENIMIIFENNRDKILKNEEYTTVLRQQCGKKRLAVVTKLTNN
ncbi:TIGR04540 family protein [Aerococcus viridans]|uniref:TIGR04540 family protein n=1 Tax=Aerococcus viridans TaxID=1377 RepID=UPI0039AF691E